MLDALQGSPVANPDSLKDKTWGKCLICRQTGYWAKECPNCDKSPKMACYKCHQLGHWAALCPWDPRASRSSNMPSLTMVQCNWSGPLQPACLSQITFTGLKPRVHVDVVGRSDNFLIDTGAAYSVLASCSRAFFPNTCTILDTAGKTITKRFTWALCCWDWPPVSGGPWVSYYLIEKRSFPAFEILQLLQSW